MLMVALTLVVSAAPPGEQLEKQWDVLARTAVDVVARGLAANEPWLWGTTIKGVRELPEAEQLALFHWFADAMVGYFASPTGAAAWQKALSYPSDWVAQQQASEESTLTYLSVLDKESRFGVQDDLKPGLVKAKVRLETLKAERPRMEKELKGFLAARKAPSNAAFQAQFKERLTDFLAGTRNMPFDAKLVETNGRKVFEDPRLEARPRWWKRCFRAGPALLGAARAYAEKLLKEPPVLGEPPAPPSPKLSTPDSK